MRVHGKLVIITVFSVSHSQGGSAKKRSVATHPKNYPFSTTIQTHVDSVFNELFTFITLQTKIFSVLE